MPKSCENLPSGDDSARENDTASDETFDWFPGLNEKIVRELHTMAGDALREVLQDNFQNIESDCQQTGHSFETKGDHQVCVKCGMITI